MPRAGTQMRAFAQAVEAAGFDVLAFPDHLVPSVSPFAGATAAAMATQRLHTGTLVLNNDFRHPVDTAREAAGVATLAEGRFELGLGADTGGPNTTPPALPSIPGQHGWRGSSNRRT